MQNPEKSNKITTILLIITIAVLLISNRSLTNRVRNLEHSINNLSFSQTNERHAVNHSLWSLTNRVNEIGEQITQSTRLTFNETARIQAYHSATASANVQVSFSLKEHTPGDTITITAHGQGGQSHSAPASLINGRFVSDITLPMRDNYTITFAAAADTIITGELMQFNLAEGLYGRFTFWTNQSSAWSHNQPSTITLHPHFINRTQGNPMLNVADITLLLEVDDIVVSSWHLTDYLIDTNDSQMLDFALGEFARMAGDTHSRILGIQGLDISIGTEPGQIAPGANAVTRLVVRDNLGIIYEQLDMLHIPMHTIGGRGSATQVEPIPVREFWSYHGSGGAWGRMRIVE